MKILINGRFLTQKTTGVQRVARQLTLALDALIASGAAPDIRATIAIPGRAAADLPPYSCIQSARIGRMTGHAWEQLELPKAVGDSWLLSLCNTGPLAVRRQLVLIHDAQVFTAGYSYGRAFRTAYRILLPALARRVRTVATVSGFSAKELAAHGVRNKNGIKLIHNGADHMETIEADSTTLARHGLRAGSYILALGSLAPHKNIDMLVRAALARRGAATELVIAGGGAAIFSGGAPKPGGGARYLGRVSDRELKSLYQNALALAFPSLTEGFGLPPVEAMQCGCPVLASTGGAIPEVCGDAVMYIAPDDQAGWTEAMERIEADQDLRARLSQAGRRRAALFTWERAVRALLASLAPEGAPSHGRVPAGGLKAEG